MRKKYPISRPVRLELKKVENRLLNSLKAAPYKISASTAQVFKAGGKRLRPALVLLAAMAGDYDNGIAIDGAVAVELIHMASLIHDDILDGASTRRGYPTINSTYGYKHAIAAGDYLFGTAFQLLTEYDDIRLIAPLSEASMALSLGEMLERDLAHCCDQNQEHYLKRVNCKTASLFKAACQIGGIIGSIPARQQDLLADYGYNLGMAFQIYDDILDLTGEETILGKPIGSDLREGIVTLPMLFALTNNNSEILRTAITAPNSTNVNEALDFIISTNAISSAKEVAKSYLEAALDSVKLIDSDKIKKDLFSIGEFVINRYH